MDLSRKRDTLVDCLRGYACFLVVFGHVILGIRNSGNVNIPFFSEPLETFIWSFHVALFMFLSGYVYKITGEWQSKGGRLRFILHKLLNLGIPYLVIAAVYIAINSRVAGVNTQSSMADILYLWRTPQAQYWFLYALMTIFVLYTVLSGAMKNWQIALTAFLAVYIAPLFNTTFGSFASGISMAFVFGLGASLPSLMFDKRSVWLKAAVIAAHIGIIGLCVYFGVSGLPIVKEFAMVIGIAASIALISLLVRCKVFEVILLFINRYSFPIYLLHTIFTAGIRIVLIKLGVGSYVIHVLAGMLLGIGVPFVIAWITDKIPVIDFVFYPSKSIKRLQKKL